MFGGYSYDGWTALALRLETLLGDDPRDNPATFKHGFAGPIETRDFVYEFLYLNGGTKNGNGTWGLVGRVNGALLWPDALRYFVNAINGQLIDDKMEPFLQGRATPMTTGFDLVSRESSGLQTASLLCCAGRPGPFSAPPAGCPDGAQIRETRGGVQPA